MRSTNNFVAVARVFQCFSILQSEYKVNIRFQSLYSQFKKKKLYKEFNNKRNINNLVRKKSINNNNHESYNKEQWDGQYWYRWTQFMNYTVFIFIYLKIKYDLVINWIYYFIWMRKYIIILLVFLRALWNTVASEMCENINRFQFYFSSLQVIINFSTMNSLILQNIDTANCYY